MSRPIVLIPVHNRRETTLGCLRHLRANNDLAAVDVILVDDGSTDGTGDAVRAEFPEVTVLRGDGNLYWAGAIALAMNSAATRGPGQLIWLNDDCHPRPGALKTLGEFLAAHPDAIAGPCCVDAKTGSVVPTGFIGRKIFSVDPGITRPAEGLSGFCVGLGARVAPRFGAPDARNFPHYFADTAYTLSASRAGARVVLLGAAVADLIDHRDPLADLHSRARSDGSFADNWSAVFSATSSPYRLRTLFAAQRLKYGGVLGRALGIARAAGWIARFFLARIR